MEGGADQYPKVPEYRGVRQRKWGRWVLEIRVPRKKQPTKASIWLGTYSTPEMAARAHDVAAIALKGAHYAALNFPELAHLLPVPASNRLEDIQAAAALAARMEIPAVEHRRSPVVAEATTSTSHVDDDGDNNSESDDPFLDLPDLCDLSVLDDLTF